MNRRKFLTSVGGDATALALSRSLDGLARAAGSAPVKRLLTFYVSSGCAADYFWPDRPGANFDLKISLAPLAPYQSKMTVIPVPPAAEPPVPATFGVTGSPLQPASIRPMSPTAAFLITS